MPGVFRIAKYFVMILILFIIIQIVWYNMSGEAFLPEGYYATAKSYAPKVSKHDRETLTKILMNVKLPAYKRDVFDCWKHRPIWNGILRVLDITHTLPARYL